MNGVMTIRHGAVRAVSIAVCTMSAAACHDVAEYTSQAGSGVHKVRVVDLALESSLEGIDGGSAILSIGSAQFLVATTGGLLYRVASQDMEVTGIFPLGAQYSSGYGSMVQASAGSVYIVGAFGTILEFGLSQSQVVDEFSAGPMPVGVSWSSTENRIYVIDGQDAGLREVSTLDNSVVREATMPTAASVIVPFIEEVSAQIAISASEPMAFAFQEEYLYPQVIDLPFTASDIAAFTDTTIFCTANSGSGYGTGSAVLLAGYPISQASMVIPLSGRPMCVCAALDDHRFYVASSLGDGTSRIYEIEGLLGWEILRTVDVPGWAVDITTHAAGDYLLILTTD